MHIHHRAHTRTLTHTDVVHTHIYRGCTHSSRIYISTHVLVTCVHLIMCTVLVCMYKHYMHAHLLALWLLPNTFGCNNVCVCVCVSMYLCCMYVHVPCM
jgi:hypothetical protein